MPVTLSEPDRSVLRFSPLALVVCQINLPDAEVKIPSKVLFSFRDRLNAQGGNYGELTQIRKGQLTLQMGPFGGTTTSNTVSSSGWRLSNRDQSWAVSVFGDSIAIEARAYQGWADSFRPRLADVISATRETFSPDVETRLGLRYINAFSDESAVAPHYWIGKITPAFLGALALEDFKEAFVGSGTRLQFDFGDANGTVALAFQPDAVHLGRTAVAVDIDVYRAGAREFSFEDLMSGADILNTRALQIFQRIVMPDFFRDMLA